MAKYPYVILGGGMVAGYAAQEWIEHGLAPRQLAIVSADDRLPYERPPLSKGFLAGQKQEAEILINHPEFYGRHGIKVYLETKVNQVDLPGKRLQTAAGEAIEFEKLVIATGARVRTLDVPGARFEGVCYLRSMDDSRRIRQRAAGARQAVVIGAGFIGMEVAAVLAQQQIEVTMVFPEERIWQHFFTPEMSAFFQHYYQERGVRFRPRSKAAAFRGEGDVQTVVLDSREELPADLVVAGIGVEPVVELFQDSALKVQNGVVVDEFLETAVAGVYAAGDVANYKDLLFGRQRRFEHWDNAVSQGQHLARTLSGQREPFVHVPYFFSDEFDLSYELWGDAQGADRVVHRGDVAGGSFSTWWLAEGRVVAAFVMNRPDEERELAQEWIHKRIQAPLEALQDESRALGSHGI